MSKTFTKGEIVYNVCGEEFLYELELDGQHFGRQLYEEFDPEYGPQTEVGPLCNMGKPYEEPPTEKLHEDVRALQEERDRSREELVEIRKEIAELSKQRIDLKAEAEKHEEFRLLLDYLEGKITHVIMPDWSYCQIKDLEDILSNKDSYERDGWPCALGLFALPNNSMPRHRRGVTWRVSHYGDGSGGWKNFFPCRSREDAEDKVRKELQKRLEEWRAGKSNGYELSLILDKNKEWLDPPQEWIDHRKKLNLESATRDVEKLRDQLAKAEQVLAEVTTP